MNAPPLLVAMLAIASIGVVGCASSAERKPTVVFYLVDTLRADSTTPYGSRGDTTPTLGSLARDGVLFEHAYAQAPWTKPSMAAILTGRHPGSLGIERLADRIPPDVPTLAEVLSASGYETVGFSANPIVGPLGDYARGFAVFHGANRVFPPGDPVTASSGSAARLNREIFRWLREGRPGDRAKPLFLYVHSVDPHEEYDPAERFRRRFIDPRTDEAHRADRERIRRLSRRPGELLSLQLTRQQFDQAGIDSEGYERAERSLYDGDVSANDHEIARLLARLRHEGLLERALVVVTSDHGEEFMAHGATSHGYSLYDDELHVPLVLWGPGVVPRGVRVAEAVASIDIYPTVLALIGIPRPPGLSGRDLTPLIEGRASGPPPAIFAAKRQPDPDSELVPEKGNAAAIVRFPWKFVRNDSSPRGRVLPDRELFRLDRDPGESLNVVEQYPGVATELEGALDRWRAETIPDGSDHRASGS